MMCSMAGWWMISIRTIKNVAGYKSIYWATGRKDCLNALKADQFTQQIWARNVGITTDEVTSFFQWSIKTFLFSAALPALATFILAQNESTKMLATITAFYLYAVPSLLIGEPMFSGEFFAPQNTYAYSLICGFWVLFSLTVAAGGCWLRHVTKNRFNT